MAYGSFAELARKAYVEEGFEHLERAGKRVSISGVSALTGLTRKETRRLHEYDESDVDAATQRYSRAIRVVSGWVSDAAYCDVDGEPRELPLEGEVGSFSALAKQYSGDIPPAAMLSVLQAAGTVAVVDSRVLLRERAYIPADTPIDKLHILGSDVAQLIDTIGHNLQAPPGERFFQRKVSNVSVRRDALEQFRDFSNDRSQALLEAYHAWLSEHQVEDDAVDPPDAAYVAVGIYYFEQTKPERN